MTNDEIIKAAKESCAPEWWDESGRWHAGLDLFSFTEKIESSARAEEREECAEVCEAVAADIVGIGPGAQAYSMATKHCAAAIRARVNKT